MPDEVVRHLDQLLALGSGQAHEDIVRPLDDALGVRGREEDLIDADLADRSRGGVGRHASRSSRSCSGDGTGLIAGGAAGGAAGRRHRARGADPVSRSPSSGCPYHNRDAIVIWSRTFNTCLICYTISLSATAAHSRRRLGVRRRSPCPAARSHPFPALPPPAARRPGGVGGGIVRGRPRIGITGEARPLLECTRQPCGSNRTAVTAPAIGPTGDAPRTPRCATPPRDRLRGRPTPAAHSATRRSPATPTSEGHS